MVAVHFPKGSALNCSVSVLTVVYVVCVNLSQSTHLHLTDREACLVVGPTEGQSAALVLCSIPRPSYQSSCLFLVFEFCSYFLDQFPKTSTVCDKHPLHGQ